MNNTIIYDNYNFEILLRETDVKIKICDTLTTDIFECVVNENDTNKHSVSKFYKLLFCGLSKEKDFIFQITKLINKIMCKITYKNDFTDGEYTEVFTANKIEETQIEKLEKQIKMLSDHINKMDNRFDMLVTENNKLKEKIKTMEIIEVPHLTHCGYSTQTDIERNFPVNNNKMEIFFSNVSVIPNDPIFCPWKYPLNILMAEPVQSSYGILFAHQYKKLNIYKINVRADTFCNIDRVFTFLDRYLSFTNCIFEEIEINIEVKEVYACVNKYISILQKYSNYKKITIKIQNGSYDEKSFANHCKKNNIELIQEYV